MPKIAIVILAGTETHEGLGRVVNALETAKEFQAHGDEARIVFDGAGAQAAATLADPGHRMHRLFSQTRESIHGVCKFCAQSFGVTEQIKAADIPLLDEYEDHPSLRSLVTGGYQVITF